MKAIKLKIKIPLTDKSVLNCIKKTENLPYQTVVTSVRNCSASPKRMFQIAHHVTVDTGRKTYNDEVKCKKGPGCCNFVCKN